jgi:hypothetical protein
MRPRTRQLELRRLFSHHLLHVFSTLSLAADLVHLFIDSSRASSIVILSYSPKAARHCLSVPFSTTHCLTQIYGPVFAASNNTSLPYAHRTVCPLQGPDRTLPHPPRQRNRMSSPTASTGSASTVSSTAQSQYQDRLISKHAPRYPQNRESQI